MDWRLRFKKAYYKVLPRIRLDYHPVLVHIKGQNQRKDNKPFHFKASWIMNEEFEQFLSNNWKTQKNIVEAINVLTLALKN